MVWEGRVVVHSCDGDLANRTGRQKVSSACCPVRVSYAFLLHGCDTDTEYFCTQFDFGGSNAF